MSDQSDGESGDDLFDNIDINTLPLRRQTLDDLYTGD